MLENHSQVNDLKTSYIVGHCRLNEQMLTNRPSHVFPKIYLSFMRQNTTNILEDFIINSRWDFISLKNHISGFLCWSHVSAAANLKKNEVFVSFNATTMICLYYNLGYVCMY